MIISLRTVPQDAPKKLDLCLEKGWWRLDDSDDQILGIGTPIKVNIEIYKSGDKYTLEGNMAGSIQIRCDRCLNAFESKIDSVFKLFFAHPIQYDGKADIELLEEDMETGFIYGEDIELDDLLREQLYLALPMKSLCREGCKGLCPVCGMDLNNADCQCRK
jgi:uncharacterized protein